MMAGDHQTDDMGIDNLTWPNSMTLFLYLIFMFLISTLTFNIFTGIAISEIQSLLVDSNIETMKERIDYIYDGSYSIPMLLEEFECVMKLKKKVFGKVIRVFELGNLIEKMLSFCGRCRDRFLSWLGMFLSKFFPRKEDGKKATVDLRSDKQSSTQKSNTSQVMFIDDKYIEYFEDIENRTKNLEEKLHLNNKGLSDTIESRAKNLEKKLDQILNDKNLSETIESRTKNLEEKLDQILNDKNLSETIESRTKNLEEKLDQILNDKNLSETIENRIKETIETKTKNLEDKLDQILTSLVSQK